MDAAAGALQLQLTVLSLGGEVILPRSAAAPGTTVGELLERLRRDDGPPELSRLLLGSRELAVHECLEDLEVAGTEQDLVLTFVREAIDGGLIEQAKAGITSAGVLSYAFRELVDGDMVVIGHLLRDPAKKVTELAICACAVNGIAPIAKALRCSTTLRRLDLSETCVPDISALADALQVNSSLQALQMESSGVRHVGGLADALRVNRTLRELNLNRCPVSREALQEILQAVRVNATLEQLSLACTAVGDIGPLVEALQGSSRLKQLNLARTDVCDISGLADVLRASRTLKILDLQSCRLAEKAKRELLEVYREKRGSFVLGV